MPLHLQGSSHHETLDLLLRGSQFSSVQELARFFTSFHIVRSRHILCLSLCFPSTLLSALHTVAHCTPSNIGTSPHYPFIDYNSCSGILLHMPPVRVPFLECCQHNTFQGENENPISCLQTPLETFKQLNICARKHPDLPHSLYLSFCL